MLSGPLLAECAGRGNAGAGGCFLALAADQVWAHGGVVLNPHYKNMGNLYGSEYWTYLLPRRVGEAGARCVERAVVDEVPQQRMRPGEAREPDAIDEEAPVIIAGGGMVGLQYAAIKTQLGELLNKIVDYDFTSGLEQQLDDIAEGTKQWVPVLREFYEPYTGEIRVGGLVGQDRLAGEGAFGDPLRRQRAQRQGAALFLADRVVVFSGGRVEQAGPAREVYERPTSAFVAGFVGTSNMLGADLVDTDGAYRTAADELLRRGRDLAGQATATPSPHSCASACASPAGRTTSRRLPPTSTRVSLPVTLKMRTGLSLDA